MQRDEDAAGLGRSWARPQRGATTTGRRYGGAGMRLGADAAGPPGRGCCRCCCCGAVPRLPTAPSLSLQLCAERGAERMREASIIPLVVLSPSPSHASSPRPPQITVPLSLLPNPPLPLSMALLNRPIHPPLPSLLPLPVHFPPFPVPLALSPPSFPFLTLLPFPLPLSL
jgi:hypothetical protein